jgi:hypothetical protein
MNSVNLRIRYRPIRLGWCVRDQNVEDLRRAIRFSHTLRGGIFNPIIPIGQSEASNMIRKYRVDALMNVSDDENSKSFVKSFDFLPWPLDHDTLFAEAFGRWTPTLLDVSHTLNAMADDHRNKAQYDPREGVSPEQEADFALIRWEEDDPLKDVLLASFGAYPDPAEIHRDYDGFIQLNLLPFCYTARKDQPIPASLLSKETPSSITDQNLTWDRVPGGATIGFYVGSAQSFDDLVNFWNLRASGVRAVFLDPDYAERLVFLRDAFLEHIAQIQSQVRHTDRTIAVWSQSQEAVVKLNFAHDLVPYFNQVDGLNIASGNRHPPLHYIAERRLLGTLSESFGRTSITFQLPEKPFPIEDRLDVNEQHFVVSISRISTASDDTHTFWTPFIPELNKWVSRQLRMSHNEVRVELEGVGIVCPITEDHLQVYAIQKLDLAKQLFSMAGIDAEPSPAGRIATRLISQLGGLQGGRVLKLAGVRRLIKEHGALQEFGWSTAIQTIKRGTDEVPQPDFTEYEDLFLLEPRPMTSKLTPKDVFHYLLEKGVFRPGLTLKCPKCELSFWVQLDDVATEAECLFCGNHFNCTRQLTKDPWQYRKSGLFGFDNNQEGSVPVALTLQQMDTHLHHSSSNLLFTNLKLGASLKSPPCETDLFLAVQEYDRVTIAVGECKDAKGEITVQDVSNMLAVAEAFPTEHFDPFVIFAKTGPFTQEEVDRCKAAQGKHGHPRVILLSDRELEPYFVYERASRHFEVDTTVISLDNLARSTYQLYFHPKLKEPSS